MDKQEKILLLSRYKEILDQIKAINPKATLIAVSKGQSELKISTLYEAGHRDFGENYAQELVTKSKRLGHLKDIRWHFIGAVQSNKVKLLSPLIYSCHTIDRIQLAEAFSKTWKSTFRLGCFVQVNIDQEITKTGVHPKEARVLCEKISQIPHLELLGLMCIPSIDRSEKAFPQLKLLEENCRPYTSGYLSMGMSSDYPLALQQGATHIRIGTLLFGAR